CSWWAPSSPSASPVSCSRPAATSRCRRRIRSRCRSCRVRRPSPGRRPVRRLPLAGLRGNVDAMGGLARQRHLNQALLRISRRAESTDRATLTKTFVTAGSFSAMLHSTDHQIIYGRRGTGKTHAMLYLSDLVDSAGDLAVYLDLRTLGSAGGLYADGSLSAAVRGTHLLVDTLETIHEELLTLAIDREAGDTAALLPALDALAEATTAVEVIGEVESETREGQHQETGGSLRLGVPLGVKASLKHRRSTS